MSGEGLWAVRAALGRAGMCTTKPDKLNSDERQLCARQYCLLQRLSLLLSWTPNWTWSSAIITGELPKANKPWPRRPIRRYLSVVRDAAGCFAMDGARRMRSI
jgi:hypothetical protein